MAIATCEENNELISNQMQVVDGQQLTPESVAAELRKMADVMERKQ